jgi:hypothetical protein
MDLEEINITNIRNHPADERYFILHFSKPGQGDYFESLLKEKGIFYERGEIEGKTRVLDAFAIKRLDFDKVRNLNYLALGKFRNKFIPDKSFRIIVFLISIVLMTLALLGAYLKNN